MPYNWIWDISGDHQGNIRVGSKQYRADFNYLHGSLLRYYDKFWYENKPNESVKASNRVNSITTNNYVNIWIATGAEQYYGYQILMFNCQEWFVLSDLDSNFPYSFVLDMVIDKNNILWIGGADVGLIKVEMNYE